MPPPEWTITLGVIVLLVQAGGIWAAMDAIMTGRTAQGTIAWAIALVLVPVIAIPFYLVFGSRRFNGYVRARRKGTLAINQLARDVHAKMLPFSPGTGPHPAALDTLAVQPLTTGNRVRLLVDGDATFTAIFDAIDRAERYVLIQFYIIRDDATGRRMLDVIRQARARGVRILILYDWVGSASLPRKYVRELEALGAEVQSFRTRRGPRNRFQINFRNHRKIVVVDGREAFLGGLNVGDEYMGLHRVFKPWRDTHCSIEGPAVQAAQLTFVEDWYWATRHIPELEWTPRPTKDGAQSALVVPSGPADEVDTCALLFTHLMHSARKRLWIATPYFVPDEAITSALQLAALRGVDVRVIIPDKTDHKVAWFAAHSYYPDILPVGVKLYRYQQGFMHQKVLLSDDTAAVGTANLDNRSLRINFEVTMVVPDEAFAEQVTAMLRKDMERCTGVGKNDLDRRRWPFRLTVRAARLLAPIL
ncbi:MAG: cardiolipin synthase [Phycisphaerales bacterium]